MMAEEQPVGSTAPRGDLQSLPAWRRYRALNDTVEEHRDLIDLADHKARFAVGLAWLLTGALALVGSHVARGHGEKALMMYIVVALPLAVFVLLQAIESVRPRMEVPEPPAVADGVQACGLRSFADALNRDAAAYHRAWSTVRIGQLNAELAIEVHALAAINRSKYQALARLFRGLLCLTLLTVLAIAVAVAETMSPGRSLEDIRDHLGGPPQDWHDLQSSLNREGLSPAAPFRACPARRSAGRGGSPWEKHPQQDRSWRPEAVSLLASHLTSWVAIVVGEPGASGQRALCDGGATGSAR